MSNPTGYGAPNPEISEIVSTNFVITDADGNDYAFEDSGYSPNSAGDSSICLQASDFSGGLTLVPGATYHIYYEVDFSGSNYSVEKDFTFPCCGAGITSNLATNIAIEETPSGSQFIFSDVTGVYNATYNTGGYGAPNPAYGDITSTLITITLADGTVVSFEDFIPTAADHSFTITASDLGYTGAIPDQIINVEYSVYADGDCRIGYKNVSVLLYALTETCINNKIATLLNDDCACDDAGGNQVDLVMQQLFMLDAIKIVSQGNIGCANGKIEALYQQCQAGCSNCN